MKKILILILPALFLLSCETTLDIPFPEHTPKLTMNGYLVEGGPIFLYVTRSFGALETIERENDSTILIRDADVTVFRNGENLGKLTFLPAGIDTFFTGIDTIYQFIEQNVYLLENSSATPEPGDEFEFVATHPDYEEARVTATVMPKPEMLSMELVEDSITATEVDGYQQRWAVFKIKVRDPGEISNFFGLKGILHIAQEFDNGTGTVRDTFFYPVNLFTSIVRDVDGYVYGEINPVSDKDFNGQEGILYGWLRLPGCCGYPGDQTVDLGVKAVKIDIETLLIDENYGIFQAKRNLQRQSRTEGIEGAILPREPVSVVGNVEGGYGLLGSFNFSMQTYKFEE